MHLENKNRNKVVKTVILTFLFFINGLLSAQDKNINLCSWRKDDKIDDSGYKLMKKTNLFYFLSNDRDFLYLDIKIAEAGMKDIITGNGLTVWIDMDGKTSRKMGVKYSVKPVIDVSTSVSGTIELIGFISEQERHFSAENPDSFKATVKTGDNGILYFGMKMPLAKLPVRNSKDGNGAMPFAIGVEPGNSNSSGTGKQQVFWINQVKLATSE